MGSDLRYHAPITPPADPHQLQDDGHPEPDELKLTLRDEMMIEYPELIDDKVANELGIGKQRTTKSNTTTNTITNPTTTATITTITIPDTVTITNAAPPCSKSNQIKAALALPIQDRHQSNQRAAQSSKIQLSEQQILNHILASPHKFRHNSIRRITPEEADLLLKGKWVDGNTNKRPFVAPAKEYTNLPRVVRSYQRTGKLINQVDKG